MGLAATVLAGVGTVTAGVIVKVLADDVKEWTPKITERLIKAAVQWLPEDQRERYGEEWAGHVWETPGTPRQDSCHHYASTSRPGSTRETRTCCTRNLVWPVLRGHRSDAGKD